jgi:murein DD-endopeptidase MepM/ murein hydrolase activator NlpD
MTDRLRSLDVPSPLPLTTTHALGQAPSPAAERARVAELAQEFEAMLMLQMVRQMRQSLLDESEQPEGFGGSTMQDTFDTEFSRYLAQSGGVGVGSFMTRTLDARAGNGVQPQAATGGTVSFALPAAAAPTAPIGPVGRSTDSVDAPTSVELPLDGGVTSAFGWRADPLTGESRFHRGVDLRAAYGTEVPAANGGTVVYAGERGTYGTLVAVRDERGVETRYAHLSATLVKAGDVIAPGTPIGRVGSSGRSAAPHLHFEVLVNGERVDPAQWAGRVGRGPLKSDDVAVD